MAYELPPLPYDYNALEPHIDEATMKLHHDKHHQAYVTRPTRRSRAPSGLTSRSRRCSRTSSSLGDKEAAVRNNGGGHANHSLFWEIMAPDGGGEPDGDLAEAINASSATSTRFKEEFKDAGVRRFGSGWAWLVLDGTGLP